ncbi:MAG: glycosyltransferase [Oscillospiraceae bacterium]|nr:glycosyltransferase [Oscillospiraceae bacterium]
MEKPLISVIVPVYNVGRYLEACLDSLMVQTWPNVEVILVNDASTDNSGQICDTYAAQDARIQAVHFPSNRGPSAARNEGIRQAQGIYISFVDADDRVEPDLLEKLYESLIETGAEISVCGADGIDLKGGPAAAYSREAAVRCLALGFPFNHVPWGKLYYAELVKQCPFDENVFYSEDLLFLYSVLKRTKRVSYLPDILYHYTCRAGSQVQSGIDERKCTAISAHDSVCKDAAVNFPETAGLFQQLALETDRSMAMLAVKNGSKGGRGLPYLKQLQANVRQHFSWKALALCSSRKNAAAVLVLYISVGAFWGVASAFTRIKSWKGGQRWRLKS